ncbi:hypothetical protein NFI96_010516 [Prochilodus magdalenae]|nr:hypothetical protein NFI96_010516 [Prochilodus magdalenae]
MADCGAEVYTVLEVVIAVTCCLGNVLVIWAVWICGALRQPTFCFIVSLAVADFLVGAVAIPLAVLVDGRVQMPFYGCLFISCMVIMLTQASVHSLLAIAVDRYLRVYIPLSLADNTATHQVATTTCGRLGFESRSGYKGRVKLWHSWAIVAACWVTAAGLGFTPMFGWNNRDSVNSTITCEFLKVIPMSYMVYFNFFGCLLPPMIIMSVLYCYIFCTIAQQLRGGVGRAVKSSAYYMKEQKLAGSLALVLALFAACWLPLHIMNTVKLFGSEVSHIAFYIGILFSHANSAVNPVVYAFKIPKIKKAYKMALTKLLPLNILIRIPQGKEIERSGASEEQEVMANMTAMPDSPAMEPWERVDTMYISIEGTIALASVMGNVLVIVVVSINRALRDATFCFIVSLALADITVGALVIPLAVVISLGLKTQFYTCLFLSCVLLMITQCSILSLLAIAIDRYLRIRIPTRYSITVTQRRARVAAAMCWLSAFVTGLVPMFGWHQSLQGNSSTALIQCQFTSVIRMDYMVYFNFFGWVVIPLTIMTGLYFEIFRVIRRQLNRRAEATSDSSKYYRKELKLAKSLALVLFLFALCWLPIHIMNCISYFCPDCLLPKSAIYVGIFMSHINSALNPLVYAFRIQRFRATLVQIAQRCVLCKAHDPSPCPPGPPPIPEKAIGNL